MEDRLVGEEHRSREDLVRVSLVWLLFFGVSIFSGTYQIQSPPYDFIFLNNLFSSSLTHSYLYREILTTTVLITGCAGNISGYTVVERE
jgi:hypothetical protein